MKVVPCCINSFKYIEDTAQLSIVTNWLCRIFRCYSATLIHRLPIVLLSYILFSIYNRIYCKYVLFLHIQGFQMHLITLIQSELAKRIQPGKERSLEVAKPSCTRATEHWLVPLQPFSPSVLSQVISYQVKLLPSYNLWTVLKPKEVLLRACPDLKVGAYYGSVWHKSVTAEQ